MLVLDAGGTSIKLGLAVSAANGWGILGFDQVPMPQAGSAAEIEGAYAKAARLALAKAREEGLEPSGMGVSTPGPFDYLGGRSLMTHKCAAIYGMSVRDFMQKILGPLPIRFIHDSFAFLLGELAFDARERNGSPCLATIGTGLGFAAMKKGKLMRTPEGGPALSVYKSPFRSGIAEDYVSARAIQRYSEASGAQAGLSVQEIARRAAQGDAACSGAFEEAGTALAEILAPLISENEFDCLLLGGQIAKSGELLAGPTRRALGAIGLSCPVKTARHIDEAPLLGASRVFVDEEVLR